MTSRTRHGKGPGTPGTKVPNLGVSAPQIAGDVDEAVGVLLVIGHNAAFPVDLQHAAVRDVGVAVVHGDHTVPWPASSLRDGGRAWCRPASRIAVIASARWANIPRVLATVGTSKVR